MRESFFSKSQIHPIILFNFSGHGNFDLSAYQAYLAGQLQDYAYPEEAIQDALQHLPKVNL
jgi:tryptophan synthase beta chain